MPYFITEYTYSADTGTRLAVRPRHREWLQSLGRVNVLSGPTDADTGVLVFEVADTEELEVLLDDDPFVPAGVIRSRRIAQWTPMTGRLLDLVSEVPQRLDVDH